MPSVLSVNAVEEGTFIVKVSFFDEDEDLVVPVSLTWTLKDSVGNIINNRENVVINNPGSTEYIILTGDDLAIDDDYSHSRVFLVNGTYNSTLGDDLPIIDSATFDVESTAIILTVTGRTLTEMLSMLGVYLNELNQAGSEPFEFSPEIMTLWLNQGQDKIVYSLNRHMLTELDKVILSVVLDSSGAFNISCLNNEAFNETRGIDGVRLSEGKFCNKLSFYEYRKYIDRNKTFSVSDPVCYMRGSKIYVEPYSSGDTIDLYYMRKPVRMVLADDSPDNINCEFNTEIQDIINDLAASIGFRYGGDPKRSLIAYQNALIAIKELNMKYSGTDSIEYGKGRFGEEDLEPEVFPTSFRIYEP